MSVVERWTIYEGINGTPGIWIERGDHQGWKGKLRGEFKRTVVVPEEQLHGAVEDAHTLAAFIRFLLKDTPAPTTVAETLERYPRAEFGGQ